MSCHIGCSSYQELQVFRDLWLVLFGDITLEAFASNLGDQWDAVSVSEDLAYDAGRISFFGELENQVFDLLRLIFEPGGWTSADGSGRARASSLSRVHASHAV